jgi:hypothetical protein
MALSLEFADDPCLVLRPHFCLDAADACLPRDRLGRAPAVTGQHHHLDAEVMQTRDAGGGSFPNPVGRDHDSDGTAVDRDRERRLASALRLDDGRIEVSVRNRAGSEERGRADEDVVAVQAGNDTLACYRLERVRPGEANFSTLCLADDRLGVRVLGSALNGRNDA